MKKEIKKVEKKDDVKDEKKVITEIVKVIENKEIEAVDAFSKLSRTQIDLMKRTVAKGSSDDELSMFLQVCKGLNLNPFVKQVFLVPRWDNKEGREVRAIQVSIDGFRAIAEESGNYAGNDDPTYKYDEKEKAHPIEASVTVYKIVQGVRCPFTATARWAEYFPGDKIGFMWKTKPHIMIGKCAEALALRKAFPKLLSGFYAQEEMDKSVSPEVAEAEKKAKNLEKIKQIISKYTEPECMEYLGKIQKSDKYTDEQKAELKKLVETRLTQLKEGK